MAKRSSSSTEKRIPRTFQRGMQYEFGHLQMNADVSATQPSWRVTPTIQSGDYFLRLGCKTPDEYCHLNPDNREAKALVFYRIERDGARTYIGTGTPLARSSRVYPADGLADGPPGAVGGATVRALPDHYMSPAIAPAGMRVEDQASLQWLQEEIVRLRGELSAKDAQLMGMYNRLDERQREITELKELHAGKLRELERRLAEAEMTNMMRTEIDKKLGATKGGGLASGPMELAGAAMTIWDLYQQMRAAGGGGGIGSMLARMMGGGPTPSPAAPTTQTAAGPSAGGVSPGAGGAPQISYTDYDEV